MAQTMEHPFGYLYEDLTQEISRRSIVVTIVEWWEAYIWNVLWENG